VTASLVPLACPACAALLDAEHLGPHQLRARCGDCGLDVIETAPPPTPPHHPTTPPDLVLVGEAVRVLAPGEDVTEAKRRALRAWLATADAAGHRWGWAVRAQLAAWEAVVLWYGHAAAEAETPSPW
jgi:hypothetical protein